MIYSNPQDQVVDDAAVAAFTQSYGERATSLPPVAVVIAAYNEAGPLRPGVAAPPPGGCGAAPPAPGGAPGGARRPPRGAPDARGVGWGQPQYRAPEVWRGVTTHGYKGAEVPATIHRRRIGESKKGQNPLYGLHLPGVNNLFYGIRFARVIYGTWWRERQRSRSPGGPESSASPGSAARAAKISGPGSVDASAPSAAAGPGRDADPAQRT